MLDRSVVCPSCEGTLNAEANYCVNCGDDVSSISSSDTEADCPDCGTAVVATDNFCFSCGAALSDPVEKTSGKEPYQNAIAALDSKDSDSGAVPESLILVVEGHEIRVRDGDTVGSEIRAALSKAGYPDTKPVRIHREHVRFIRKSDSFYVLDMADNSTHLNGSALSKGDQKAVTPGDELELSGVAVVTIQSP